jgi:lipopolysaccharide export system protein LptA
MRSLRWLLLVAMLVVLAAVARIYQVQRTVERRQRRAVPRSVSLDTKSEGQDWEWGQSGNGQPQVKLFAKSMIQSTDLSHAELQDIELRIYQKDGLHYDRVKTATATFTTDAHKLYAPGDAQITLDVPVTGDPPHHLTSITTAGINFDSTTGQAVTDKHVAFTFESGDGTCMGASYDPTLHRLDLNDSVTVNLRGNGSASKPMKVESAHLTWDEATSLIQLDPWSRLTRDQTVVNAGKSTILIKDNVVNWIDAVGAKGTDEQPGGRHLEYSADMVHEQYNDAGQLEKVTGTGNAKLISHGNGSDTTVTGNNVDLFFTDQDGDSVLSGVTVNGNGYVESKPDPDPKGATGDTKVMKAEAIDLRMKPGGKDLDRVTTRTPGTLEFLPNQIARHRRLLKAEHMDVVYGAKNEIQSFLATAASTETYPSEDEKRTKKNLATAYTVSKNIDATFDEHGQMKTMKQSVNFRYTEGVRKAQADSATLENDSNVMTLETHARISDDTGSTGADRIRIEQNSGNFEAIGHVSTTRLPEHQKSESAMLDKDEPTQGTADHVTSTDHNEKIRYVGHAVVWQSSNRIEAEKIDIDRDHKTLIADGNVITQFQDDMKDPAPGTPPPAAPPSPIYTVVHSQHMVYTDPDRLANYSGTVDFRRPSLIVKSAYLKAWLNEKDSGADSRINHAQGDGKVEITEVAPDRQRVGTGDRAEYYTDEGKVILTGGEPQLNDSKRGNTKGEKLTYYTDDDRLLVDGVPKKQVHSHLRKKS